MPCNIGYKNVGKITIPQPQLQEFKERIKPLEVDPELLEKIGVEDPIFIEWLGELDIVPILKEALRRAQGYILGSENVQSLITKNGYLELKAKYVTAQEKSEIERLSQEISRRFQMEVLKIVAELLDYVTVIRQEGDNIVLIGEKGQGLGVNRYLKIESNSAGQGLLRFEHFDSPKNLKSEQQKFLALAQKLGVKLCLQITESGGQPILHDEIHKDFLGGGAK